MASAHDAARAIAQFRASVRAQESDPTDGLGPNLARYRNLVIAVAGYPAPARRAELARVLQALHNVAPA